MPSSDRPSSPLHIAGPDWLDQVVDWSVCRLGDEDRMALAVQLARENVRRETGGPFGAAVFESASGALVAVGVNSVTRLNNCVLHAETMAIMQAQQRVGTFTFGAVQGVTYELVTSCDPCAMCLGAVLWSGVHRLVCGAGREDAAALGFDEGPVFPQSWSYLEERGIGTARGVLRAEAVAVLELYRQSGGPIYNA